MKKHLRIIAVLMIAAMMLSMTACSGGGLGQRGDGKVTLTFTHMWPEHAQLMKELCQEYSAQNPNVVIKPAYVQYNKIEDTLKLGNEDLKNNIEAITANINNAL